MNNDRNIEKLETKIESLSEELLTVYEELNLFYDLSNSFGSSLDLENTIDLILNKALNIVEADKATLMVMDESENKLKITRGWRSGIQINIDPSYEMNAEGTILSKAIQTKRGLIDNDITTYPNGISPLIATTSLLSIPLQAQNKTVGLFTLGDKKGMGFTSKDLKLATVLSSQAALVIENHRLFQSYIEKERLERELEIAQEIQKRLQPLSPPNFHGYDIAALSIPCIKVGGDYYDFIPLANSQLGIVIGDVMGHGVGAALLMATVRSALRILSQGNLKISDLLYRINNMLINDLGEKKILMSMFYGILEPKVRRLTFSNAGHDYPFVLRSSPSTLEFLKSTGTVMGMFDHYSCNQSEIQLNPGDVVLLYTDGVVEVTGDSREQFSRERLYRLVQENRHLAAKSLIDRIHSEVAAFSGSRLIDDDLMLVVMKVGN